MIRNWVRYQHYKDRRPPWVKLYSNVLADPLFARLQDASKAHALLLMTVAAELDNRIPADATWLAHKLFATEAVDLDALASAGWLAPYDAASAMLAESERAASNLPPQRTENREQNQQKEKDQKRGAAARATAPAGRVEAPKPVPASAPPVASTRKHPHFPDALRVYLHGAWEAFVGPLDLGRFVKTLGPAFADRPPASPDRLYCAVAAFGQERDECDARERGFRTLERFVADLPAYLRAGDRVARSPDWALPADVVAAWAPYAVRELAGAA